MSRDPIEEKGGLNLYGFVGNDGVNDWDLLGLVTYLNFGDNESEIEDAFFGARKLAFYAIVYLDKLGETDLVQKWFGGKTGDLTKAQFQETYDNVQGIIDASDSSDLVIKYCNKPYKSDRGEAKAQVIGNTIIIYPAFFGDSVRGSSDGERSLTVLHELTHIDAYGGTHDYYYWNEYNKLLEPPPKVYYNNIIDKYHVKVANDKPVKLNEAASEILIKTASVYEFFIKELYITDPLGASK